MDSWWDTLESDREGPTYLAICDALAAAIHGGRVEPGGRLPSHRMLAHKLGVSVGTVTRAYQEACDLGLIAGKVGRGSYVSFHPTEQLRVVDSRRVPGPCLDLIQNSAVGIPEIENKAWNDAMAVLQRDRNVAALSRRSWSELSPRHQEVGAAWIARTGLAAEPSRIFDCPGTLPALCAIFSAATKPGDVVLTASLSHPMVKLLGNQFSLKVQGLPMDQHGIEPDAFEAACRETPPALIYCGPTIHAPTTVTMPDERRRAIAQIANRHDVLILEDEPAAFLLPEPVMPISAHAPTRSFFVGDLWLSLSPGLRTTYVLTPEPLLGSMSTAVASTCGVTAPMVAEVAAHWLESGAADRLIEHRRTELVARNSDARELLCRGTLRSDPYGHHVWLELPEPWRSDLFVLRAERLGIAILGAEWFAVGHGSIPEAVRICIGNAPRREELRTALKRLDQLIAEPHSTIGP